jgi:hypothetical protein
VDVQETANTKIEQKLLFRHSFLDFGGARDPYGVQRREMLPSPWSQGDAYAREAPAALTQSCGGPEGQFVSTLCLLAQNLQIQNLKA